MKSIKSYVSLDEYEDVIRLDCNEINLDIDREKIIMLKGALNKVPFNRYPDNRNTSLRKLYADYAGEITEKNVLPGNGSDEIIGLVIGTLIESGKKVLTFSKEFSMYDYYTSFHQGELIKYETARDGKVNVKEFIELGKKEDIDFVIFSNPNNPTGNVLSSDDIEEVLEAFNDKFVLVDEAYYEFYGESVINLINKYKNLLVTRTLSKAWGLAALRIGFLISAEENIEKFKALKVPYTISSLSNEIASEIISDKKMVKDRSENIIAEREILYKDLKYIEKEAAMEVEFYNSRGNFIFGRTPYKEALITGLKQHNIIIRDFDDDTFRITVGSSFENKRVAETLKEIFTYGGEISFG